MDSDFEDLLKALPKCTVKFISDDEVAPFAARMRFNNKEEYVTTMRNSCLIEQELLERKLRNFTKREHKMVAVEVARSNDREYNIFLPPPANDETKIQPEDMLKILLPGQDFWSKAWMVVVTPPLHGCPEGWLTGRMYRPKVVRKNNKSIEEYDTYTLSSISADEYSNAEDLTEAILDHKGIWVRIRLAVNDSLHKRRLRCIENMERGIYNDEMTYAIEKVLMGDHLNDVRTFDVFRSIRDNPEIQPEALITGLNEKQREVVTKCRCATAGLVAVQGPPGTGKTHLIVNLVTPYIMNMSKHKVLVTTQTNAGTDNLALLYQDHIDKLREQHPELAYLKQKYVVRAHASELEQQMYASKNKSIRTDAVSPTLAREATGSEKDAIKTLEVATMVMSEYLQQDQSAPLEVVKKHERELDLSLGVRMLEMANFLATGPKPNDPDHFAAFRALYTLWMEKKQMDAPTRENFWTQAEKLRNHVLKEATIVCTTVTNAGSDIVRKNLKGCTDLIITDEMPRCQEVDALLLFMGEINPCGYIMVGDPDQLGPYVESSDKKNPYVPQMRISVQERLQKAGFPFVFLEVQHRMDPELSRDTSEIVYGGRLKNHESTIDRDLMKQVSEFNKRKFGINSNKILLDLGEIKGRQSSITHQAMNKSRYNEDHLMYSVNLAEELSIEFPGATVAILTGYQAQYHLLKVAKQAMVLHKSPVPNIEFHKVDTVQGFEFDIVILDHLFLMRLPGYDNGSGGFMRERARMNVATTRARHAMYVMVDVGAYENIPENESNRYIREYMRRWMVNDYEVNLEALICKYYTPGSTNVDTGLRNKK